MKVLTKAAAAAIFLASTGMAQAAVVSVFTDGSFSATSTIEDDGVDRVRVTLEVDTSTGIFGDIRAWYSDSLTFLDDYIDISGDITGAARDTNDLGQGTNVKPLDPLDVGLAFGSPGIGENDVQLTSFFIIGSGVSESSFEGVDQALRVTSVGPDGSRSGSLKLTNTSTTPVPLPAAGFMLLAGLGGLALFRRRK